MGRLEDIEERLKAATPGRWRALTIAPDELAWLLRVARAAELVAHCLRGYVSKEGLRRCRCDGCDLRRALEGDADGVG